MKKFLGLLNVKKRRKQENSCNRFNVPPSQPTSHDVTLKNSYKCYQFDSDSCTFPELQEVSLDQKTENSGLIKSFKFSSISLASTHAFSDLFENGLHVTKNNSDVESSDSNVFQSPSTFSLSENFPSEEEEEEEEKKKKKSNHGKNMYVINISNSKCFHIGSQKIINTNEKQMSRIQSPESGSWVSNHSAEFKTSLRKLLDCEEKPTEVHISLISIHLNDGWRSFLKNLGLEETLLGMLEFRNDNDRALIVYDAVQKYLSVFPNTSLGFISSVLLEVEQITVIQKLLPELKLKHM